MSFSSGFEAVDVIEFAKDMQWQIAIMEDPTEASLKSSEVLADLYQLDDKRFRKGNFLTVQALGAYIMNVSLETGGTATAQLDAMVLQGECAGLGFIQNIGNPRIQTLYLGLRSARVLEAHADEDGLWVSRLGSQPLVVPVLDIEAVVASAA